MTLNEFKDKLKPLNVKVSDDFIDIFKEDEEIICINKEKKILCIKDDNLTFIELETLYTFLKEN